MTTRDPILARPHWIISNQLTLPLGIDNFFILIQVFYLLF